MRYTCDLPGFEHAFIEFDERWTRAEYRAFADTSDGEAWLALLRAKTTALCLPCNAGEDITTPADLTEPNLDRVDLEVYQWFVNMPWLFRMKQANQGEVLRRRLWDTAAAETAT